MIKIPWVELKQKLLLLPPSPGPVLFDNCSTVVNESDFLRTHINIVDQAAERKIKTQSDVNFKLLVGAPHYNRLLAYYIIRTEF